MFDSVEFLTDYNIQTATDGPNTQPGWINVCCPFCWQDYSFHGGFNIKRGYYNCWKCGWHSNEDTVMELLGVSFPESKNIVRDYQTSTPRDLLNEKKTIKRNTSLELPRGTQDLDKRGRKYLINNKFDPEHLESKYGIKSTGHLGTYKFRLVVPIYFGGKLVSYQCRDVTGRAPIRWKACNKDDEVKHFKHIVYNWDACDKKTAVVVEGLSDVWRLGDGAVAVCGTGYTDQQVRLLSGLDSAFILFDKGKDAQAVANKLALSLSSVGVCVELMETDYDDPGVMPQTEADAMMREIMK